MESEGIQFVLVTRGSNFTTRRVSYKAGMFIPVLGARGFLLKACTPSQQAARYLLHQGIHIHRVTQYKIYICISWGGVNSKACVSSSKMFMSSCAGSDLSLVVAYFFKGLIFIFFFCPLVNFSHSRMLSSYLAISAVFNKS